MHVGHGISCHVDVLRPFSRGTVALASSDPRIAPVIDPQFLSDERDVKLLVKGGQIAEDHRILAPRRRARQDDLSDAG
jgi:choline dehydrogenase